ncbi:hypothetical protein AB3M89_05650 [Microbacterium sp. 179-I 3D2 NHS]|uniref:hypothetical protein n=1 Tax=Microbacterium sp. 179-I 3D2 NHS TaxID=3235178 RepID=UPI0039A2BCE9
MTDASAVPTPPSRDRRTSLLIGVGGGILGLLPWVVGGGILPLQNLWASPTMPDDMPFVLLPLSQYSATLLFSLVLLGGVFAGVTVRVVARRRELPVRPASLGVAIVHLIAVVQGFAVLAIGHGLGIGGDSRAVLYVAGMLGGTIVAAALAQLGLWMTSRSSVAVAALGVALAAVPFASWVARWFIAFTGEVFPPPFLPTLVNVLPALIVGAALVWCGARPARRIIVWIVSLLALWVMPALFTAIQAGLGMRVLQGDLVEMAKVSAQVFPMALVEVWMPPLIALAIAVIGTLVRMLAQRDRDGRGHVAAQQCEAGVA